MGQSIANSIAKRGLKNRCSWFIHKGDLKVSAVKSYTFSKIFVEEKIKSKII